MRPRLYSIFLTAAATLGVFLALCLLHAPLLRLPYFWDEAGYYVPAALDFCRQALLVPHSTLPTGHTPLLSVYLGAMWRLFGFSPFVTRAAMILVAALTIAALCALGRCVVEAEAKREIVLWSALLLALSPLFFAQSSLAHLEILVALFTILAVTALLRERLLAFAFFTSLAILSKETAVIFLPVAWLFAARRGREKRLAAWMALVFPVFPLLAWTLYYHRATGFWTGNAEYLQYNLYTTLNPVRIILAALRRIWELFLAGFNWVPLLAATIGIWLSQKRDLGFGIRGSGSSRGAVEGRNAKIPQLSGDFIYLCVGLWIVYLLTLSLVGGAILSRYLLPAFPVFYLIVVTYIWRLPRALARPACVLAAACLVGSWFTNPPYPFPFENNLAYADFVRLHQEAARFLQSVCGDPIVLTAWPASGELTTPALGYVNRPLRLAAVQGFTAADFEKTGRESFDLLYLYSRRWEPKSNWLARSALLREMHRRYFGYAPQIPESALADRYHLRLLLSLERRGQWIRIYSRR
jgi:4-amino-4-deoxy-L-arabinose transferase-like glycosyltransferase